VHDTVIAYVLQHAEPNWQWRRIEYMLEVR